MKHYGELDEDASQEGKEKLFGVIASDGQVHLPIRLLHRDLSRNGFPVLRYQINWAPEQRCPLGYVTHGTDRVLWTFRKDMMNEEQIDTARRWLDVIGAQVDIIKKEKGRNLDSTTDVKRILTLRTDQSIGWEDDHRWDSLMHLAEEVLPGEPR